MIRIALVTLAITAMYLLLQYVWLAFTPSLAAPGEARDETGWVREAAETRATAAAADGALPAEWRAAAWTLGFQIGYVGHIMGSVVASAPEQQQRARQLMAPRLESADQLGHALGVGPIAILPFATADDYVRESERLESDELQIAARVEAKASGRHRHLLLLGMHVGTALAGASATGGALINPSRPLVGRHATLAGVPAEAWEPVTRVPSGSTAEDRLKQYADSVVALAAAIGKLESWR
jgi:hypothetical protein